MHRSAKRRGREATREGRHRQTPLVLAPIAVALLLGACSSISSREDLSTRPPSLQVAKAALASGAPELALHVADLAIDKQPENASAFIARGDALYTLGRANQAQIAYRAA